MRSLGAWLAGERAVNEWEPFPPAAHDDFWYGTPTSATHAGVRVTPESAMRLSAVYACVRIWSFFFTLPLILYNRVGTDGRERAREHRLYTLFRSEPNEYQTAFEWQSEIGQMLALRGNSYHELRPGARGAVDQFWPIHPDHVEPDWYDRKSGRRKVYDVSSAHDGRARVLDADQVLHLRLLSDAAGLRGLSPIEHSMQSIGLGQALEVAAARFHGAGARPSGFLAFKTATKNQADKDANRKSWDAAHGGPYRSGGTAVLTGDVTWNAVSIKPNEAQHLESRQFQVIDIARIYGIPLWLLQSQEKETAWGSGLEQMVIGLKTFTMAPPLQMVQQALNRWVVREPRMFVEFLIESLLWTDTKSLFEAFAQCANSQNPWMDPDEMRAKLNLNPWGGDRGRRRVPLNSEVAQHGNGAGRLCNAAGQPYEGSAV